MTRDRVNSDEFPLSPEILSQMLGVRRSSRAEVVAMLGKAGLIRFEGGTMALLDPQSLESAACECYQVLKQEFDHLRLATLL
jgi:uncharacterized phage-like protein YoqJ